MEHRIDIVDRYLYISSRDSRQKCRPLEVPYSWFPTATKTNEDVAGDGMKRRGPTEKSAESEAKQKWIRDFVWIASYWIKSFRPGWLEPAVVAGFTLLYVYSLQSAQDETGFSRRAVEGWKEVRTRRRKRWRTGRGVDIAKRELEMYGGRRWSFDAHRKHEGEEELKTTPLTEGSLADTPAGQ